MQQFFQTIVDHVTYIIHIYGCMHASLFHISSTLTDIPVCIGIWSLSVLHMRSQAIFRAHYN